MRCGRLRRHLRGARHESARGAGRREAPIVDDGAVMLGYQGLDGSGAPTRIAFDPPPDELAGHQATFHVKLPPREATRSMSPWAARWQGARFAPASGYERAFAELQWRPRAGMLALPRARAQRATSTSGSRARSADLRDDDHRDAARAVSVCRRAVVQHALRARRHHHRAPDAVAGARRRARRARLIWRPRRRPRSIPEQDAQPGKILHETRAGEMAGPGRGSVRALLRQRRRDAAVRDAGGGVSAGAPATGRSCARIWPTRRAALAWIERYGDLDGDGFVEYARQTPHGLVQQGWKDSHDSVFHADGTLAEAPIALCEVQGYVYARVRRRAGSRPRWASGARPSRLRAARARCERVRASVLVRRARHLRARARRPQAALPGAQLERRARLFTGIADPTRAAPRGARR